MKPKAQPKPRPFTVSEVMHQVRACLEDGFRPVFVRGEVANKSRPRSGHLYLTLRDGQSSLRIVAFASVVERSPLEFQDGDELHVWGRITAYPRSGDVQLVADRLEPAGAGAWREQKERLRKLRTLAADYAAPAWACPLVRELFRALQVFEQDMHRHVHLENSVLLPRYSSR